MFDYQRAEAVALERCFQEAGLDYSTEILAAYKHINRAYWKRYEQGLISHEELRQRRFSELLQGLGITPTQEDFGERYLHFLAQGSDLLPGAEALIGALDGRFGLVLMTNGIGEIQRARLAASRLSDSFEHVLISSEIGAAKPAALIFKTAMERIGSPSISEVLMVGDSLQSDIRGAWEFGMDSCWFNPGAIKPDPDVVPVYEIRALSDLPPILEGN
ncbi:MAG: YjjG family noncanonical pyrimidine nucleotidase [Anaerolineales bacterium]|nr:YjjG family noncanonical pyrimidine nucleotidase [Anaerolineales bacterium]